MSTLYQCAGVYGVINGSQTLLHPRTMVKLEKNLKTSAEKGDIKDLVFGSEITVTQEKDSGLFKQLK
jgi:hypothetical protein